MSGERRSWRHQSPADTKAAELQARQRVLGADSASQKIEGVRDSTVEALREVAGRLAFTRDEAKQSAKQVRELREELKQVEAALRKAAEPVDDWFPYRLDRRTETAFLRELEFTTTIMLERADEIEAMARDLRGRARTIAGAAIRTAQRTRAGTGPILRYD